VQQLIKSEDIGVQYIKLLYLTLIDSNKIYFSGNCVCVCVCDDDDDDDDDVLVVLLELDLADVLAVDKDVLRHKQTAMRGQRLRLSGDNLAPSAYDMRKVHLCRKKVGMLREKVPGAPNPMSNPSGMMDMMKNQLGETHTETDTG
jgi:hypothetical protein